MTSLPHKWGRVREGAGARRKISDRLQQQPAMADRGDA